MAGLTGKSFFPQLISQPFHHGLVIVFTMAVIVLVIASLASLLRGGRYVHEEAVPAAAVAAATATEGAGTDIVSDEESVQAADAADAAEAAEATARPLKPMGRARRT